MHASIKSRTLTTDSDEKFSIIVMVWKTTLRDIVPGLGMSSSAVKKIP